MTAAAMVAAMVGGRAAMAAERAAMVGASYPEASRSTASQWGSTSHWQVVWWVRVRELIEKVEVEAATERARQDKEVMGVQEICEKDPQTRPNTVSRSPAPRVHAATKKERKAWREAFTWFVVAYRIAADLLKEGYLDAPFPEGCFPPGLPFVGDTG